MKYLGIDFGERRVGLAVGDSELRFAFPRETIDTRLQDLWIRLDEIVLNEKIDHFVVGMPFHPDGRKDGKNMVVKVFIDELKDRFPEIPIFTQDESYSSVQALQQTSYMSRKKKKDKGIVDRAAATIILQNWLDGNI